MKIIHAADLHLGSSYILLPYEKQIKRRAQLLETFSLLVDYAKENDIHIILLAGDVFDKDKVKKSDKDFFYGVIENNKDITFLYLKGNHDIKSLIERNDISNLKTFNDKWSQYVFDNVCISGIELNEINSKTIYDTLSLTPNMFNIVMIHGQESYSIVNPNTDIIINNFKNKNIDYIALGHIHTCSIKQLDKKTTYAYPGCLEGRGFDETNDKGFILIDTDKRSYDFISFAKRKVYKIMVDISDTKDSYQALLKVSEQLNGINNDSLIQIVLTGNVKYDYSLLKESINNKYEKQFTYLEIKMDVFKEISYEDYQNDRSLKGEVIREILKADFDEKTKNEVLSNALKLLNGEDL